MRRWTVRELCSFPRLLWLVGCFLRVSKRQTPPASELQPLRVQQFEVEASLCPSVQRQQYGGDGGEAH